MKSITTTFKYLKSKSKKLNHVKKPLTTNKYFDISSNSHL